MKPLLANNPLLRLPETFASILAAEFLRAHGWRCEEPAGDGEEFEVTELARILERKPGALLKRLHHPACPPSRRRLGPTGRLLTVTMTPALEAWLQKPCSPGKKLVQ